MVENPCSSRGRGVDGAGKVLQNKETSTRNGGLSFCCLFMIFDVSASRGS